MEHNFSKVGPYLTASIGIATIIPKEELSPSLLVLKADEGLYESKEKGRNTFTAIEVDMVI
ncbi:diguanylate cyclase domain-containing protein [Niallia sp. MER TA 168]|uniref:diguanylate cyclase domain-containing protein n=1 Tax=Niallia sp. MER TA 168 TaxID=2939568 RepID=UPI0037C615DD